jgi:hypothetical protein
VKTSSRSSGRSRGSRVRSRRADSRLRGFPSISRERAKVHTPRALRSCWFHRASRRRRAASSRRFKADRTKSRMVARMMFVASRRANSPSSRSREHGDLRSTPTKTTIASVPAREVCPRRDLRLSRHVVLRRWRSSTPRRGDGRQAGLDSVIDLVAGGRGAALRRGEGCAGGQRTVTWRY